MTRTTKQLQHAAIYVVFNVILVHTFWLFGTINHLVPRSKMHVGFL